MPAGARAPVTIACDACGAPRAGSGGAVRVLFARAAERGIPRSRRWLVFLPGRWQNARTWARDVPDRDLRVAAARAGLAVASIAYRTTALQSEVDRTPLVACRTSDLLDDVDASLRHLRDLHGAEAVDVIGFSLGAALAFLVASHPVRGVGVRSLVALDGGLKSPTPTNSLRLDDELAASVGRVSENPAYVERFRRAALVDLRRSRARARGAPAGRSLALQPGGADYLRALLVADRVWPEAQLAEMRSFADFDVHPELPWDAALGAIRCPILAVMAAERRGAPHRALASARRTSSSRVDARWLDGWGHLEVHAGDRVADEVNRPVLAWLDQWG